METGVEDLQEALLAAADDVDSVARCLQRIPVSERARSVLEVRFMTTVVFQYEDPAVLRVVLESLPSAEDRVRVASRALKLAISEMGPCFLHLLQWVGPCGERAVLEHGDGENAFALAMMVVYFSKGTNHLLDTLQAIKAWRGPDGSRVVLEKSHAVMREWAHHIGHACLLLEEHRQAFDASVLFAVEWMLEDGAREEILVLAANASLTLRQAVSKAVQAFRSWSHTRQAWVAAVVGIV